MSEEPTRNINENRSLEERILARFDALESHLASRFDAITSQCGAITSQFEAIASRFDAVDSGLAGITARVESLETQAERRALETKSIWEKALAEILETKQRVDDVGRKIDLIGRDLMQVRANQLKLESRIEAVESNPA